MGGRGASGAPKRCGMTREGDVGRAKAPAEQDGAGRPAAARAAPAGRGAPERRRQASARGGEPSGPLRKTSGVRCAAKQASNPWPEVASAGGTARRGCHRGWDREREKAKAACTPPSRRAPRDRREGASARGPAFAIPATVARAGRRTSRARAPALRPEAARRKSGEGPGTISLAGRTVEVVDFASVTNRYDYDALGQRVAGTDGLGNVTAYADECKNVGNEKSLS